MLARKRKNPLYIFLMILRWISASRCCHATYCTDTHVTMSASRFIVDATSLSIKYSMQIVCRWYAAFLVYISGANFGLNVLVPKLKPKRQRHTLSNLEKRWYFMVFWHYLFASPVLRGTMAHNAAHQTGQVDGASIPLLWKWVVFSRNHLGYQKLQ